MKKRILSLLLVVCMLVGMIPMMLIPAAAADAGTATEEEKQVTISFRSGSGKGTGILGDLIAQYTFDAGFIYFGTPTDAECYLKNVNPKEILGWYTIDNAGNFIDARAYNGTYITEDLTFYPVTKSSTFSLYSNYSNIPNTTADGTQIISTRGGWNGGLWTSTGFHGFTTASKPASGGLAIWNGSAWTYGGMYYTKASTGYAWVLSGNANRVVAAQYTAPASGKVNLNFDTVKLFNGYVDNSKVVAAYIYMAVAVNGKIVWPTTEGVVGDDIVTTGFEAAGWYKVEALNEKAESATYTVSVPTGVIEGLEINGGDTVQFLLGMGNKKIADLAPSVTYTEVGEMWDDITTKMPVQSSSLNGTSNQPTVENYSYAGSGNATGDVVYYGGWTPVFYSGGYSAGAGQLMTKMSGDGNRIVYVGSGSAFGSGNIYIAGYGDNGSWLASGYGSLFAVSSSNEIGWRYTAENGGYVDVSFEMLTKLTGAWSSDKTRIQAAIYIDGVKVWPESGYYQMADLDTNYAEAANATIPKNLLVQKGGTIEFIVKNTDTSTSVYGGNKVCVYANVTYNRIVEHTSNFFEEGNMPVVSSTPTASTTFKDVVTYPGAWDLVTYYNSSNANLPTTIAGQNPTVALGAYYNGSKSLSYLCRNDGISSKPRFMWNENTNWGVLYRYAVSAPTKYAAGFRYTAEYTGMIDIELLQLMNYAAGGQSNPAIVNFAIFHNGKMIWPTDGAWEKPFGADYTALTVSEENPDGLTYSAKAKTNVASLYNDSMPSNLFVAAGDKIEFLFNTSGDVWKACGNHVDATISYSRVLSAEASASASLGADLAETVTVKTTGNMYVQQGSMPYVEAASLALQLSTTAENAIIGTPTFGAKALEATVSGLAAKQMTDEISYTVTGTVQLPDGTAREGVVLNEGTTSIASYMKALLGVTTNTKIKDLVLATLSYGAEAQEYFDYKTDALANAGVTGALSFETPAAVDEYTQTKLEGGQSYFFSGVSLLLNDTVQLKLLIDAVDAPIAGYEELYLATDGSSKQIALKTRIDETGKYLAAYVSIPYSRFGDLYTFRVCDANGNPVTGDITYSVSTYLARTAAETAQAGIVAALQTLGVAVDNFVGENKTEETGEIVARFLFISDAHVGEEGAVNASGKLAEILQKANTYYGVPVDGITIAGDLTNNGYLKEYQSFVKIMNQYVDPTKTEVGAIIGNHEHYIKKYPSANDDETILATFDMFKTMLSVGSSYGTGENDVNRVQFNMTDTVDNVDHHLVMNGIHIIGISERTDGNGKPYNTDLSAHGYETGEEFLLREVAAAAAANAAAGNPNAPILVYSHVAAFSESGSNSFGLSAAGVEEMANYPQVIWFSGHSHNKQNSPTRISQKNYTNVDLGTAGSKVFYSHKTDAWSVGGKLSDGYEVSQGVFLTIDSNNVVRLQRYDFFHDTELGQEWVIDSNAVCESTENFTYTADRKNDALAPVFTATDKLTVTATATTATVTAPIAHVYDSVSDDCVTAYYIVVVDEEGNIAYFKKENSWYWLGEAEPETNNLPVTGLTAGTKYTVMVVAESIYGKSSAALTLEFTTPAQ